VKTIHAATVADSYWYDAKVQQAFNAEDEEET